MQLMSGFITVAVLLLAFTAYAQTTGGNAAAQAIKNPVASTPASITAGAAAFKNTVPSATAPMPRGTARSPRKTPTRRT